MAEFLHSMAYPFLACLILTGIHVYLGIHVIQRKVIFVDLALATIAALGAVWGALLGWDVHENVLVIKGFSLAFTIVGAAVFSLTRMRHERVPHEAFIGIAYAVALAAIILGSSKLPHGAEELRDLQAGSILWIGGGTIFWTAVLYAGVGVFHFLFRRQFFAISRDPEKAEAEGLNVRFWDFLFYVSFGFVVTSSVSIAGVLLVFSYLVIPSVIALLFAETVRSRLLVGWVVGTLVSATGVTISYYGDMPSGPVIVVCFGAFLVLAGTFHFVFWSEHRVRALGHVVGYGLLAAAFLRGTLYFEHRKELEIAHLLETGSPAEKMIALAAVEANPELFDEVEPELEAILAEGDVEVRLRVLGLVGEGHWTQLLDEVLAMLTDPDDIVRE
ncbi:MAG TPA: metal ABC transporter permease, partial [Planctomycetes bacterium]|nr:metal ABC transporter permease [Planctomycetota bacterium]